jgi:putative ABC transport system permease protein
MWQDGPLPKTELFAQLSQSAVLVAIGLAAGVPASLVAARSAESLLFGLSPHDATTILAASGLLAAIAACASLAPAWRAARIEPTRALREE